MKIRVKNEHRKAYREGRHAEIPERILRKLADEIIESVMAEPEPEPSEDARPEPLRTFFGGNL